MAVEGFLLRSTLSAVSSCYVSVDRIVEQHLLASVENCVTYTASEGCGSIDFSFFVSVFAVLELFEVILQRLDAGFTVCSMRLDMVKKSLQRFVRLQTFRTLKLSRRVLNNQSDTLSVFILFVSGITLSSHLVLVKSFHMFVDIGKTQIASRTVINVRIVRILLLGDFFESLI